jgi:GNAT superfamily N-acetyltransferase
LATSRATAAVQKLFDGFTGLHGLIDSALEGIVGQVIVDDEASPRVVRIAADNFHAVAGDPGAPLAEEIVREIPPEHHLAAGEAWLEVTGREGRVTKPYARFAFSSPERWDRAHVAHLHDSIDEEFNLKRVNEETIAAFEGLARSLVANFGSRQRFLALGVGFGVMQRSTGRMVAGCSSYAISSHSVEFEIQTHPEFQRRGLALATGAAMVEHCLDNGLEPCWDAAHEGSALLAERLGFVGRQRYTAYVLA